MDILDNDLKFRVNTDVLETFKKKSKDLGKDHPVMIREIMTAFNEDRLKIVPTDAQKEGLKIYEGEK